MARLFVIFGANKSLLGAVEGEIEKFRVVSPKHVHGFASVSLLLILISWFLC